MSKIIEVLSKWQKWVDDRHPLLSQFFLNLVVGGVANKNRFLDGRP